MTQWVWNSRAVSADPEVEVSDETLLFVPTMGEPVEWGRHSLSRGSKTRRPSATA